MFRYFDFVPEHQNSQPIENIGVYRCSGDFRTIDGGMISHRHFFVSRILAYMNFGEAERNNG